METLTCRLSLFEEEDASLNLLNNIISLKELGITPQNVFFDFSKVSASELELVQQKSRAGRPYSVTEALLDASRSIGDQERRLGGKPRLRRESNGTIRPKPAAPNQIPGGESENILPATRQKTNVSMSLLENGSSPGESTLSTSPEDRIPQIKSGIGGHILQHRSSTISLLHRGRDKAAPETGTVPATAFGEVDHPFDSHHNYSDSGSYASSIQGDTVERERELRVTHSRVQNYGQFHNLMWQALDLQDSDGHDPHVLKLLDNLFEENFPIEMLEFGPAIVAHSKRQPIKRSNGRASSGTIWRPDGNLVAHYGEHSGAVNRIVVAPDHAFFVTGSDDGTVKVWDAARLERNVASRSRQTYRHGQPGTKVKSVCFIEGHHCFVSAATDGSVHVVRVDYPSTHTTTKYGKLKLVKQYQLLEGEWVVWMEHYKADTKSILLMATNKGDVIALELRTMKELWRLHIPVHHGTPTAFCMDRRRIWLVVGTSHGVIDMFDLRFLIRVKAWGLPSMTSIHRIALHPSKGRGKWICVAGGCGQGEITVWDVEKSQCREVYRAATLTGKDSSKGYEPWRIDDFPPEGILTKLASSQLLEPNSTSVVDRGVRAIVVAADVAEESAGRAGSEAGGRGAGTGGMGFMISAGADRKIRYWNLGHVEASCVVSGLDVDEAKPTFTQSQLTTTLTFNAEKPANGGVGGVGSIGKAAGRRGSRSSAVSGIGSSPGGGGGGGGSGSGVGRPPRSTVISMQQQQLLRSHLDSILDVSALPLTVLVRGVGKGQECMGCMCEYICAKRWLIILKVAIMEVPYGMCISADRSGNILVFQ